MSIQGFWHPENVAVVGASPGRYFADRLAENLAAGSGDLRVMPVHPRLRRVWGHKVFASLAALPARPDLVILLVGAREVPGQVRTMARLGIQRCIVLAEGLDDRSARNVAEASARAGVALLGAESLGALDVPDGMLLYCGRLVSVPRPGDVSIVSQSGGLLNELFRATSNEVRFGFRRVACVGTQLGIRACDVAANLVDDDRTATILALLDDDPATMAAMAAPLARARDVGKNVVILGTALRDSIDPSFVRDNTQGPSLASGVLHALSRSTGAFLARDVDEVVEAAALLARKPRTSSRSRSVALVSVSQGVGKLMASAAGEAGLRVVPLGARLARSLKPLIGRVPANPLDLSAAGVTDPAVMEKVVTRLAAMPDLGAIMVAMHPPRGDDFSEKRNARWLSRLTAPAGGPGPLLVPVQVTRSVALPEQGLVQGLHTAMRLVAWWMTGPDLSPEPDPGKPADGGPRLEALRILHGPARTLSEPSSRRVLETYGLPFDDWFVTETPSQASRRARQLGGPVCLKLASPDVPLKSFTRTDLVGDAAVRDAFMELTQSARHDYPGARILGVLVTPHRPGSPGLLAATVSLGPGLPPLLVCGPSGPCAPRTGQGMICELPPLSRARAMAMASGVLAGVPGDPASMADLLLGLGRFASDLASEVATVELDGIVFVDGGFRCSSARVRVLTDVDARPA